jgi:NAD(P)-dependent dehydrogenase (short-subunit alcohol dehydrogenase family)
MDLGLDGRVALVTGASKGIGFSIAECLLGEGARVAICARNEEHLERAHSQLAQMGTVAAVSADMRDPGEVRRLVGAVVAELGPIDVLVNNAAGITTFGGYDELGDEDWLESFEMNLMSAVHASQAVIPAMRERRWGRIVNILTESAVQPDAFMPHYAAQKAALLSVTKSMSKALAGTGILVNAVSPAFIKTPIIDTMLAGFAERDGITVEQAASDFLRYERPNITVGRPGRPEEVARIVAVLCSEAASFVNGTNVRVDAGSVATIA